jgi:hypothetical protein
MIFDRSWFTPGTGVSSPIKLTATIYYSWNIVESGVKQHYPNPQVGN